MLSERVRSTASPFTLRRRPTPQQRCSRCHGACGRRHARTRDLENNRDTLRLELKRIQWRWGTGHCRPRALLSPCQLRACDRSLQIPHQPDSAQEHRILFPCRSHYGVTPAVFCDRDYAQAVRVAECVAHVIPDEVLMDRLHHALHTSTRQSQREAKRGTSMHEQYQLERTSVDRNALIGSLPGSSASTNELTSCKRCMRTC